MTTNKSHFNTETLRAIYADLSCIAEYADDNVVLHTAERGVASQPSQVFGKEAVLAKELELIRLTGNTLVMEVQDIVPVLYRHVFVEAARPAVWRGQPRP